MTSSPAPAAAGGDDQRPILSVVDGQAHGWWLLTNRAVHSQRCGKCRRAPGGPDHVPEPRRIR